MTAPGDPASLRILVIDDDADTRANLRDILELDGYQVSDAGTAAEALRMPDWGSYFAVILDRKLPDGSAEELLPKLKQLSPQAAVIIVTGYADLEGVIAAIRQGAADYLLKPVSPDVLRSPLAGLADRRRAESEIARLTSDLRTLLDVLPVGIAIAEDPEASRIRINPALAGLLQLPHDPNAWLTLPPEELPALALRRAAQGVEVKGSELELVRFGGEVVTFYVYAAPLLDERGSPRGAVGAFLDVTERKRGQERLLQTERLAAIGQMVTGLAHESGNALARSQSCLEMLAWEVEDRPEAIDLIHRIQKAQDHLKQLYDEVRSYAAPLKLEREPWSLSAVWRQTWDHLAILHKQRRVHFREETGNVDLTCPIDPFRLDQVFRNIFENALAACTDPVEIVVRCREVLLESQPAVCVSVQDNGPGLSPEQRRRIFDPFFTTKTKGTGLGMAIAKRIVDAHGGQIAIGPALCGAELTITLPTEHVMTLGLRIVVADDEQDMRDYFERVLPRLGHQVVGVARTGRELVELCRTLQPDLVITDVKMPELDGIEAAIDIYRDRPVAVLLVSAYHDETLIARAAADHILGYLVKPIKQADLPPAISLAWQRFQDIEKLRSEIRNPNP